MQAPILYTGVLKLTKKKHKGQAMSATFWQILATYPQHRSVALYQQFQIISIILYAEKYVLILVATH